MSLRLCKYRFGSGLIFFSLLFSAPAAVFAGDENPSEAGNESDLVLSDILDAEIEAEKNQPIQNVSTDASRVEMVPIVHTTVTITPPESGTFDTPLAEPVRWAKEMIAGIEANVQDYSCTVTKRERINGILGREEVMTAKLRHEPFSVYLHFEQPRRFNGREVIYFQGRNQGEIQFHGTGFEAMAGTLSIPPTGRLAMRGNLHPITDLGFLKMAYKLVEMGEQNLNNKFIQVDYQDAVLDGRKCVRLEIINTDTSNHLLYHKAHIYIDSELNIPVKYISWGFGNGRDFPLMEEYTYSNIKLNQGFTDKDFSTQNPEYNYR